MTNRVVSSGSSVRTVSAPTKMASLQGAHPMRLGARPLARDPARVACLRSDASIEGDGRFERHPRPTGGDPFDERAIDLPALRLAHAHGHGDSALAQVSRPAAVDTRVGIGHAGHHADDAGLLQRHRTAAGATDVIARLQRHVRRRSAGALAGLFQRRNLGVVAARSTVKAGGHELAGLDDHTADHGVGTGLPARAQSGLERQAHPGLVGLVDGGGSGHQNRSLGLVSAELA